ncbi:hypothetical protein LTR56_019045 [Elasticomyces elasticus]|nr:hypothetical protein LTR56_019045 [Elasticomyces elasticus]KAK3645034.1 hypothetical protein LTR22_014953 [Elasticomyces elasticus]KAK4907190.1 hypothetical protein LTR49_023757 [Elasticomyces elasticus]KAK5747574.1 hypothetical protein LTS12_022365 [Elasticomyces elasticus]
MSAGPSTVVLKRKRDEPGPERLIVQAESGRMRKKVLTSEYAAKAAQGVQYVRREDDLGERRQGPAGDEAKKAVKPVGEAGRRVFRLKRSDEGQAEGARQLDGSAGRSKVATFVEARATPSSTDSGQTAPLRTSTTGTSLEAPARQLKRPGRGAAVQHDRSVQAIDPRQGNVGRQQRTESVAGSLHQFALDEIENDSKQKITSLPKYPGRRRGVDPVAASEPRIKDDEDADMDDADYVYDTYVLAPAGNVAAEPASNDFSDDVGYLIITDEDQSIWETYIEDDPSDRDCDTDEEDENAEDYYGADYPEDEMASDDEGGRNAYDYRKHGGSEDEEWDEDTGAYSDDDQFERTMNPWKAKTPKDFVSHQEAVDGGDA